MLRHVQKLFLVLITICCLFAIVIVAMIVQLIMEIRHGMANSSSATKRYHLFTPLFIAFLFRYQTRAVFSLVLQVSISRLDLSFAMPFAYCVLSYLSTNVIGAEEMAHDRLGERLVYDNLFSGMPR